MSPKRKKQKSGGSFFLNSVSAIIICVALALGIGVFFRVSAIEVSGASRYSDDEIIEASGVDVGSSIIFLNRESAENKVSESLVYLGRVSVSRKLPNTVVIDVQESGTVGYVSSDEGLWLIDIYCRALEQCAFTETEGYMEITGFSAVSPEAGKKLTVPDEDKAKLDYLEDILTSLYNADMLRDVGGIDMSTSANPQFEYLGRFRVKLGEKSNTEAKLALLADAVEKLEPTDTGVIDLSDYSSSQKAYFSPE